MVSSELLVGEMVTVVHVKVVYFVGFTSASSDTDERYDRVRSMFTPVISVGEG